jgi:hypothetical protein
MKITTAAIAILLLAGAASPAAAQTVRGRLLDLDSGQPLDRGTVRLIGQAGDTVATSVTGEDGAYVLTAPLPGWYYIEAHRLGYGPWIDGPVQLEAGEEWDGEFLLRAIAIVLDPVEVTAPAVVHDVRLDQVGFYERQMADFGHFMTRDHIEMRRPVRVSDLLTAVPGVRLVPSASGTSRQTVVLRGSYSNQGRSGICHPRVFVDGIMAIRGDSRPVGSSEMGRLATETRLDDVRESDEIAIDDLVMPNEIQGIEIYRSSVQVPAKFGGTGIGTRCGVIVIWTRQGTG